MPLDSWLWLIAAALITGFGAFYLLTHATKRLKAGELAAISYQETSWRRFWACACSGRP